MVIDLSREELESNLEKLSVYTVLNNLAVEAKRDRRGGALNHRIVAMGYLAETGARKIKEGETSITISTTFDEMHRQDDEMYQGMISFLYPLYRKGLFKI